MERYCPKGIELVSKYNWETSFVWRKIEEAAEWQDTSADFQQPNPQDFARAGNSFLALAEQIQSQTEQWWQHWQLKQYGNFACTVPSDWSYPQQYLVQQVSVRFLSKFLQPQERDSNQYPEDRATVERATVEDSSHDVAAASLLLIAHSEDIQRWQGIIAGAISQGKTIGFEELCQHLKQKDWGKDKYSKVKVYLAILLSDNYQLIADPDDFYGGFLLRIIGQ